MEKERRIEEIINIELTGISRVILEYSTDHFVINYASKLKEKEIYDNRLLLTYVIKELNQWYKSKIDEILNGEYIINKDLHIKSFDIINELNDLLSIE